MKISIFIFLMNFALLSYAQNEKMGTGHVMEATLPDSNELMIRIAEIEIEPDFLDAYLAILKEESEASVRLEAGVIAIFPMFIKENHHEIRIIEIYANREAYEFHLQTTHFKHYKSSTSQMVKSLKLIDMEALDSASMSHIFKKLDRKW